MLTATISNIKKKASSGRVDELNANEFKALVETNMDSLAAATGLDSSESVLLNYSRDEICKILKKRRRLK